MGDGVTLSLYSRQKIEPRRREEREGGFCWFVIILEERPRITTHQALTGGYCLKLFTIRLIPFFIRVTFQFRRKPPSLEARREDSVPKGLGQGQERGDV